MVVLKRLLLILVFVLWASQTWAGCTYISGSISCYLETESDYCVSVDGSSCILGSQSYYMFVPYYTSGRAQYLRYKVSIPKGATISTAKIQYIPNTTVTSAASVSFDLIEEDSTAVFTTSDTTSSRTYSNSPDAVVWSMGTGDWVNDSAINSADIKTLVQSWIGREGYVYDTYIGLYVASVSGATHIARHGVGSTTTYGPFLNITFTGGDPVLSAVYMAEPHIRKKQYLYVQLYNTTATQKLKVTLDDVAVTGYPKSNIAGQTANGEEKVLVDYTGLTAGSHTLRVAVTDADDVEIASTVWTKTWTTLHDGAPYVGIDENNAFVINGVKTFLITDFVFNASTGTDFPDTGDNWANYFNTRLMLGNTSTIAQAEEAYINPGLSYAVANTGFNGFSTTDPRHSAIDFSLSETFEGTGTILGSCGTGFCWSSSGTVDFDDTSSAIAGSQSCKVSGAGYAQLTLNDHYGKVRIKFAVKTTTRSGATDLVSIVDNASNIIGKIKINASNNLELHHCAGGTCTGTTLATGTYTVTNDAIHYLWFDYETSPIGADGNQGSFDLYVAATSTKPTTADASIDFVGSGEGTTEYVRFSSSADNVILFDSITDDCEDLKEWIAALKSTETYPKIIGWISDDEPDMGGEEDWNSAIWDWTDFIHGLDTNRPVFNSFYGSNYLAQGTSGNTYKNEYTLYTKNKTIFGYNRMVTDAWIFDPYMFHFIPWHNPSTLLYAAYGELFYPNFEHYLASFDLVVNGMYGLIPVSATHEPADISDDLCSSGTVYYFPCSSTTNTMNVPVGSVSGTFTASTNASPKYVRFGGDNTKVAELLDVRLNEGTAADSEKFKVMYPYPHPSYNSHIVIHELNSSFDSDTLANGDDIVDCTSITGSYGSVTCTATGSNTAKVITGDTSKVPYLGATTCNTNLFKTGSCKFRPGGEGYRKWTPAPTPDGFKNSLWLSIIHGGTFIATFPRHTEFYLMHKSTMSDFKTIVEGVVGQAILSGPDSTKFTIPTANKGGWASASVSGTGRVDYTVRTHNGVTYVFAGRVKKYSGDTSGDETATMNITGLPESTTVAVYGESRNVTSGDGTITDDFDYHDVHIYTYGESSGDVTAPTITEFIIPSTASSVTVSISSFTATDAVGVTGYCLSETNAASSCNWFGSAPATYTFASAGEKTLYAFAKDAAGNVSSSSNDSVTITLTDTTAPTVTGFVIPSTSASLTVPITTFTCTDDTAVTGYCIAEGDGSGDCTWSGTAQESYTFLSAGSKTLHAFCKDAENNISSSSNDAVAITVPFNITPATSKCQISPDTTQSIGSGGSVEFTISSPSGYRFVSVTGCTGSWSDPVYTITSDSNCTFTATCGASKIEIGSGGTITFGP